MFGICVIILLKIRMMMILLNGRLLSLSNEKLKKPTNGVGGQQSSSQGGKKEPHAYLYLFFWPSEFSESGSNHVSFGIDAVDKNYKIKMKHGERMINYYSHYTVSDGNLRTAENISLDEATAIPYLEKEPGFSTDILHKVETGNLALFGLQEVGTSNG